MEVVVIGGGLAGLVFSLEALKTGHKVVLIEKEDTPGGLLKTESENGYVFDTGGSHIIFSREPYKLNYLLNIVGRKNLLRHRRDTRIYYKGRFIKYPFENGIYMLPPRERYEILKSVIETYVNRVKGLLDEPKNFEEWIYYVFGNAIAEKYLVPYNKKIWKRDLKEISLEWVKGRVPLPPIDDVLKSAVGIPTEGYRHQLNFYYPLEGGIYTLVEKLLSRLSSSRNFRLITGVNVEQIYKKGDIVFVNTGDREFKGDVVVSTAPLPQTLGYIDKRYARKLDNFDYNSLLVIGIGTRFKALSYHWIYFPQNSIVFHRLAILSNYSPKMAPKNGTTFLAEISIPPGEQIDTDKLERRVIEDLLSLGIIKESDVVQTKSWFWKYAYIVYRQRYSETTNLAKRYLLEHGVIALGRFGSWTYINMDETAYRARMAARNLKSTFRLYRREKGLKG